MPITFDNAKVSQSYCDGILTGETKILPPFLPGAERKQAFIQQAYMDCIAQNQLKKQREAENKTLLQNVTSQVQQQDAEFQAQIQGQTQSGNSQSGNSTQPPKKSYTLYYIIGGAVLLVLVLLFIKFRK